MKLIKTVKENYLLVLIILAGAFLRLYKLDFQSIWLDEIHTLNDANPAHSLNEVYDSLASADLHPPLYFYMVHFLFLLFGYTAFVARLFSAVIGIYSLFAI
jgi:uncharacterized membrane protein